ncbi:MAG: DinB family protein [Candidatus Thorarchaeota archaeon]
MSEKKPYGNLIDQWNETRAVTFQIANTIPNDVNLDWKPHPDMNELHKLMRHLVAAVYFHFKNYLGKPIDYPKIIVDKVKFNKEIFLEQLNLTDKMVKEFLQNLKPEDMTKEAYTWEGRSYMVEWVVWNLKGHERWHQAQLKMYLKLMGIDTTKIGH